MERMVDDILLDISERLHALLVVDIDNFKAVSDLHGHQMGDHTICAVADLLSARFRQSDIVGRIGGDEFVVLMRNVEDKDIARQKAEEIIAPYFKRRTRRCIVQKRREKPDWQRADMSGSRFGYNF